MVVLDNYKEKISDFIFESVDKFTVQHGDPSSVGIYCCPWSGWVSVNFNRSKSFEETNQNCPDFEYVEYELLDFPEWEDEYNGDKPMYQTGDKIIQVSHEEGGEELNRIFFSFLFPIIAGVKTRINKKVLLQFLDSNCIRIFDVD